MKRWLSTIVLVILCVVAFPFRSPAPLIYTPGEGWTYETAGGEGKWRRQRAKDQLEVAQKAFDAKDYGLAKKAAYRVVTAWPYSDYAPQGQYLYARCFEQLGKDEKAFKEYQKLLEKFPKVANYEDVLQRQFAICNRYLNGERFKLWGYIPTFPSMDKTVNMYEKLIKNGPYSDVAAQSQMNIGTAREKQSGRLFNDTAPYEEAAKAYELAADRYHDHPKIASDALYKEGLAYKKQASRAEYDQTKAEQAIETFQSFKVLYPDDPRVATGDKTIADLKTEQARGSYQTAKFYELNHRWKSALIYYNEVALKAPGSSYATNALQRITALQKLTEK